MYPLVSALGALVMLGLAFLLSRDRRAVSLRAVLSGVALQWLLAYFVLRSAVGQRIVRALAELVQSVLDMTFEGSAFVFGALGQAQGGESGLGVIFAFQVLPTIIFVASLFAVLYHLGIMQLVVRGFAQVTVRLFGVSGAESLVVVASVFMGQTEAPLTIRPYLESLTESELFTVMVAGMASVSGAILGAYVLVGQVSIEHLLTAVAMTAPISLTMAKIIVPESAASETAGAAPEVEEASSRNVLDAAATGAGEGLTLALNVGAVLIAFIALIALLNLALAFLCGRAGLPVFTLEQLLGWGFSPLAALMGVPWSEATQVGGVLGTRTVVNEIVAFDQLRLLGPALSERSRAIATFAICGFANVSSIGIQIGGLGVIVPSRKADIARLGLLALAAATLANFSTACVAGAFLR